MKDIEENIELEESQREDMRMTIQTLREYREQLEVQHRQVKVRYDELAQKIQKLRSQESECDRDIVVISETLQKASDNIHESQYYVKQLTGQKETMENEIADLNMKIEGYRRNIDRSELTFNEVGKDRFEMQQKIEMLQNKKEYLDNEYNEMKK